MWSNTVVDPLSPPGNSTDGASLRQGMPQGRGCCDAGSPNFSIRADLFALHCMGEQRVQHARRSWPPDTPEHPSDPANRSSSPNPPRPSDSVRGGVVSTSLMPSGGPQEARPSWPGVQSIPSHIRGRSKRPPCGALPPCIVRSPRWRPLRSEMAANGRDLRSTPCRAATCVLSSGMLPQD